MITFVGGWRGGLDLQASCNWEAHLKAGRRGNRFAFSDVYIVVARSRAAKALSYAAFAPGYSNPERPCRFYSAALSRPSRFFGGSLEVLLFG